MKDQNEVKFMIKVIELGIIPPCKNAKEFKDYMQSLSPDERRRAKRKFRKIWRKLLKEDSEKSLMRAGAHFVSSLFPDAERTSGKISSSTKRNRRYRVFAKIRSETAK